MEQEEEIIIECWVEKFCANKKISIGSIGKWQKRYAILKRIKRTAYLQYFTSRPKELKQDPKGNIVLEGFHVRKYPSLYGHKNVCLMTSKDGVIVFAFDCEKIFHLFVFFLQTQMQLKEHLTENCFKVRPDNSVDQCKIGARGNMCILYICKGGLILALELSRCVLAQWPLHCIKSYEATGLGSFSVEVGRCSPMSDGIYIFKTRAGEDDSIYSTLDIYVNKALAQKQHDTDNENYKNEIKAAVVCTSDERFINQLKRISRDIYDHLWQHGDESRRPSTVSTVSTCETLKKSALVRNQSSPTLVEMVPRNPMTFDQSVFNLNTSLSLLPGQRYYNEFSHDKYDFTKMSNYHTNKLVQGHVPPSSVNNVPAQMPIDKKWPYVEVQTNAENIRDSKSCSESSYEYMKANNGLFYDNATDHSKSPNSIVNNHANSAKGNYDTSHYNYIDWNTSQIPNSYSCPSTQPTTPFNSLSKKDLNIASGSDFTNFRKSHIRRSISNPDLFSAQFNYSVFSNKGYSAECLDNSRRQTVSNASMNTSSPDEYNRNSSFSNSSSTAPLLNSPSSNMIMDMPGISRTPETVSYRRKFNPPIHHITSSSV